MRSYSRKLGAGYLINWNVVRLKRKRGDCVDAAILVTPLCGVMHLLGALRPAFETAPDYAALHPGYGLGVFAGGRSK